LEEAIMLPRHDLALAWERWCGGETLLTIASDLGVSCSQLHDQLQGYLDGLIVEKRRTASHTSVAA
jgi:hypothetical protein